MRILLLVALGAGSLAATDESAVADAEFLRPYVAELRNNTPPEALTRIRAMPENELIWLHMGYGRWIRNKWLWGNRDPELIKFFGNKGIKHPDDMSMILITALWRDLNKELSPDDKASIEAKRRVVAEKRTAYETLMRECSRQLARHQPDFEDCYAKFGLSSKNPQSREPFYALIVSDVGKVARIDFFTGGKEEVKTCLRKIVEEFTFSSFTHDKTLRLYITRFPDCRVQELDHLFD